jgi:hypothetical protein
LGGEALNGGLDGGEVSEVEFQKGDLAGAGRVGIFDR